MRLILFITLITLNFNSFAAEIDCKKVKEAINSTEDRSVTKQSIDDIKSRKDSLVILTESKHYDSYFFKLPQIYDFFKKLNPDINCLYSEISQDVTENEVSEAINGIKNRVFSSVPRLGFGKIYESIYRRNDHVISVDAPMDEILKVHSLETEKEFIDWVSMRDDYMIDRILQSFSKNECKSGVYNVGSQHTYDKFISLANPPSKEKYVSFGSKIKSKIKDTIIIEQVIDERLNKCQWSTNSFLAPTSNKQLMGYLTERNSGLKLKDIESKADYLMYIRPADSIEALNY